LKDVDSYQRGQRDDQRAHRQHCRLVGN